MAKPKSPVRLGLIQTRASDDPEANLKRTLVLAGQAVRKGARILCTQELFRSRYFCQSEDPSAFRLAESIPGPSTQAFQRFARQHKTVVVASLFERRSVGLYHNTAVIIDADGSILGRYRKMHIPDDPGYYEKYFFTPGDLGFPTWTTHYGKIGVLICWDQWFPEAARLTALQGAQILLYPTAIGWHPAEKDDLRADQHQAWELIQRSHAVANGCFVAACNRIGLEHGPDGGALQFWGQSFVAGPSGQVLARASADREEVLVVSLNLEAMEETRIHWPFLRDRRIESYSGLTQRWID